MKAIYFLLATLFLLQAPLFAEMRMWRGIDGTAFMGEYLTERLGRYYFKDEDGKTRNILAKDLSPLDRKYIQSVIPPKVKFLFKKKEYTQEGTYADKDTKIIEGVLTITKASRQPWSGKLDGALYYIGDEEATDDYRTLAKKKFVLQFPNLDEKDPTVVVKLQAKARVYEEYNYIQIRGSSYEGYLVVLISSDGEVVEFDTDIRWLTEDKIDAFLQLKEYEFFDEDCKKRPVPRPDNYTGRYGVP